MINIIFPQKSPPVYTILTMTSTVDDYQEFIYPLNKGDIFYFDNTIDYQTIRNRLIDETNFPSDVKGFDVAYVQPGTLLYTLYGANCCVVTKKVDHTGPYASFSESFSDSFSGGVNH